MFVPRRSSPSPPAKPVFLLGVGAQKAATSWTYDYLAHHPQAAMPAEKQMDFFSLLLQPEDFAGVATFKARQVLRLSEARTAALQEGEQGRAHDLGTEIAAKLDSMRLPFAPEEYVPQFTDLLVQRPNARLTGDITPEYACLTEDNLGWVRDFLVDGGFEPRVVFVMRDPVERVFSMLRMQDRMNGVEMKKRQMKPAHIRFAWAAMNDYAAQFTRYERTVAALDAVFAPEQLFYGFYEDYLTKPEIKRLCGFLGLRFVAPRFERRVNASPQKARPSVEALAEARAFYAETYQFCAERFGRERVERLWSPEPEANAA